MKRITIALLAATLAGPALAQPVGPKRAGPGTTVLCEGGNTGGVRETVIAPGATGASTTETDSAAGGNAAQPERRVPQGSGGGSEAQ